MDNLLKVAVAKVVKAKEEKEASSKLVAGEYYIDETIRIKGKVTKGEDYDETIWVALKPMKILAVALSKQNNVTADYVLNLAKEALAVKDDDLMLEQVNGYVKSAIEQFKQDAGKTKMNGIVTTKLTVEQVKVATEQVKQEEVTPV